jgi:predicted nucleotidyltransferase
VKGKGMAEPRDLAETFVRELRSALAERLQSATLFGSAARGEWLEGISDVNVLVLLDRIDPAVLERASPPARSALARGVTPLLMEVDEWRRAADVFTIELADMKEASVPLFGDDPASVLPVQPQMLRLQAERELRAKLLHLHGAMLVAADDARRLGQILLHALPSVTAYLRAALRLAGKPVPNSSRAVIETASALIGVDPAAFLRVLEARTSGGELELRLTDPLVDGFNRGAAQLSAYIDAFGR